MVILCFADRSGDRSEAAIETNRIDFIHPSSVASRIELNPVVFRVDRRHRQDARVDGAGIYRDPILGYDRVRWRQRRVTVNDNMRERSHVI